MANSIAEAKAATESLLLAVKPHIDDALGLMSLSDFLPVALQALETMELFEAGLPDTLQSYKFTCEKLTEAIRSKEASLEQKAWRDVTVEGESWADHMRNLQLYVQRLQAQAVKKKWETPLPQYEQPPPYDQPS